MLDKLIEIAFLFLLTFCFTCLMCLWNGFTFLSTQMFEAAGIALAASALIIFVSHKLIKVEC